jgi:hypothetical protein
MPPRSANVAVNYRPSYGLIVVARWKDAIGADTMTRGRYNCNGVVMPAAPVISVIRVIREEEGGNAAVYFCALRTERSDLAML